MNVPVWYFRPALVHWSAERSFQVLVPGTGTSSWFFWSPTSSFSWIIFITGWSDGFHRVCCVFCSSGDQYEPSFYKLENENNSVCLATGFSRFRQLGNNSLFNQTEAVRISEDSLFNQVAFINKTDECGKGADCVANKSGPAIIAHPVAAAPPAGWLHYSP